jgi:predicted transcriptional regulator
LSRILSDLRDRGWVVRHNDTFEATEKGAAIAAEVEQFVENIETAESLNEALAWLPTELLGFDLANLRNAEVLTPDFETQTGPMRQLAEYISRTEQMQVVATGVTYEIVEVLCRAGLDGELSLRCVIDDRGLEGIQSHPNLAEMFGEMVELGHCEANHFVGEDDLIDCNLLDDVVMFCGHSDDGRPAGILVSENTTVRSWMSYYFESLCDESVSLQADSFTV